MPWGESEALELGWLRNPFIALKNLCAVGGTDSSAFWVFPLDFSLHTREGGKTPAMGSDHCSVPSLCKW